MIRICGLLLVSLFFLSSCVSTQKLQISKAKDIPYIATDRNGFDPKRNILDIYYPADTSQKTDVLLFIHGGGWLKGNKYWYFLQGKNFAKKNVIFIAINYRLAPALYKDMAFDAARAVRWTLDNIEQYGGNPERIFIAGHSAGGHLAGLISLNKEYFDDAGISNPLKGCVLIDAFGLNMTRYFRMFPKAKLAVKLYPVFTKQELNWQAASPVNYIPAARIPFMHLVGERTFPVIKEDAELFKRRFEQEGKSLKHIEIKGKQHIPMIGQMASGKNIMYRHILDFIAAN